MRSADSFSPLGHWHRSHRTHWKWIFGGATEGQTAGETTTPSVTVTVGTGLFAVVLVTWALRG
ncbi:hypothetical protein HYG81_08760 [Natrinema zhouii]|uniref:Uncharacterized protein n=1 Tax=Natrinema zhouii TaxID=1710539 RepID=A0A7D6GM23_9EURY|nr:hypothetical protein [Natrinema zhouii]QLK27679.1 hypothetical protein HYG81_08760 [Natrinema zhouii]